MKPRFRNASFVGVSLFGALCAQPAVAFAQDGNESRDVKASMDRYRDYLSRKPFHDWSFDKLVEAAVAKNQLKELVELYEKQQKDDPENRPVKIVLARLYARIDRADDALALAQSIQPADPAMSKLIGELQLRRNDAKAAIAELEKATKSDDPKFLQEVHRARGKAYLALGDRQAAAAAFRAIAALEPSSFNTRLDVATALSQHGLHDEAAAEFAEAQKLAGEDNSKKCRVLAELGKLQEQRLKVEDALATYEQALTLMGRGNWLKKDIQTRILAIYKRSGGLDKYIATLRDSEGKPAKDLDAREFLAQALEEANKKDEARQVLLAAVKDFPDDLKLSRRLIGVLTQVKAKDDLIAEYQRTLGLHPEEVDMYLELGKVFAEDKRLEQAKIQWEKLFQTKVKDPELCSRLADIYALYGMESEAIAMHEKAIELQPKEIHHYADLCAFLEPRGKHDKALEIAVKAAQMAAGNASSLEQVAQIWRELAEPAKARDAIEGALALKPKDPRLLTTLADLQYELKDDAAAGQTLRQVINIADESSLRLAAVDRLIRAARKANKMGALAAEEKKEIAGGSKERAPYLILGKIAAQERDFAAAITQLEGVLKLDISNEEARKQLARLYEDQGEFELALAQYQALVDKSPQGRRQYLKEMARIHLSLYDQDKAFALYDEILKGSPDNAAAFKEVADAFQKLALHDKAAECLRQAIRLKPEEGKYHLELASLYKRLNEPAKAREELVAAMHSAEEDSRNTARKRYYEHLTELGQVDEEVAKLRRKIEENPYDNESPVLLTDLYIRELEYQLALDMLENLLTYQADEPKLLEQRARILGLLDKHDESIRDYERLIKLPKADRDALTLKIAEAAIEAGNLARAQEVTATIRDSEKVAKLYRKHNLLDPALTALEKSVSQNPKNPKTLAKLADLYKQRGEREKAVQSLERALTLLGDDWKTIQQLGQLHFELGDKDEALECGKRLFSAIHKDDSDDKDKQADEEENRSRYYYGNEDYYWQDQQQQSNALAQLIEWIQQYFTSKGMSKEFGELVSDEVKLQPRNTQLLQTAINHLVEADKNGALAAELVDHVWKETVDKNRLPANMTMLEWQGSLDSRLRYIYTESAKIGEGKIEELTKQFEASSKPAGNAVPESKILFLVQLLDTQRKEAVATLLLTDAVKCHPKSARLTASLAMRHFADKKYADAERYYLQLLTLLPIEGQDAEIARRQERDFRSTRREMLNSFPVTARKRVTAADLKRLFDLQQSPILYTSTGIDGFISEAGVRSSLAHCYHKLNRDADAKKILAAVKPRDENDYHTLSYLGGVYYDLELFDEAEPYFDQVRALDKKLEADPILAYVKPTSNDMEQATEKLARIQEKRGKILEAYDLLRTYGRASAGELMLTEKKLFDAARAEYTKKLGSARAELVKNPTDAVKSDLRDAGIKLAEIHQFEKKWNDALAVYKSLVKDLPDAFEIQNAVASLQERSELYDDAIATRFAMIQRKRELNRISGRDDKPVPRTITPILPPRPLGTNEDWVWNNLSGSWSSRSNVQRYPIHDDYVAILRSYLDRKRTSKAAETLRDLAREDVNTFRWMAWNLARIIDNYNLGTEGLPILRLLYSMDSEDSDVWGGYARALLAANQIEEAQRILTKIVNKSGNDNYNREEAQEQLTAVEARLGISKKQGLDELKASIDKDPKNVKLRVRLARKLFTDRKYPEALEQARSAEALAPHLDEVVALVGDCLKVCGEYDALKVFYKKQLQTAKNAEDAFTLGVSFADLLYAEGDVKAVESALDDAKKKSAGSGERYSISAWYQEKGQYEKAAAMLEAEIAELGSQQWVLDQARPRLQRLKLVAGDLPGALALTFKKFEEANNYGDRDQAFRALIQLLRTLPDPSTVKDQVEDAAKKAGGVKGELYRAAFQLAVGASLEADQALADVLDQDKSALYLYPLRISLARGRNDLTKALALLDEMGRSNSGSESSQIYTTAGNISERDAFRGERGSLLYKIGRKEEAMKLWEEIADPTRPEGRLTLARIYEENELYDLAIDMLKGYLDKKGERDANILNQLAGYYLKKNNYDEAIAVLKRAEILEGQARDYWTPTSTSVFDAYLRAGKLREYLAEQQEKAVKDPTDVEARRKIAQVATLVGDDKAAIDALEWLSTKPGFESTALPNLADRYQAVGDFQKSIDTLEKMASGGVNRWSRDQLHSRIARLYLALGNPTKAKEMLVKGFDDPESIRALQQMGGFYLRQRLYAEAAPYFEKIRELDPNDSSADSQLAQAYTKSGKNREALDAVFRQLRRPEGALQIGGSNPEILWLAAVVKEDERIAAGLAANPADDELLYRAAILALFRRQYDDAIARFTALEKTHPKDCTAIAGLRAACFGAKKKSDTIRHSERLAELLECEGSVKRDAQWQVSSLRNMTANLYVRDGELEKAIETWRRPNYIRFREVSPWSYTFYNSPQQSGDVGRQLKSRRLYKEALTSLESEAVRTGQVGFASPLYVGALYAAGERDRAIELLWRKLLDPLGFDTGEDYYDYSWRYRSVYYGDGYEYQDSNSSTALLLRLYAEQDRLADLEAKLVQLRKDYPDNANVKSLWQALLRKQERHEDILALTRKDLEKSPSGDGLQREVVGLLRKLKRYSEAVPIAEERLTRQRSNVGNSSRTVYRSGGAPAGSSVRFSWAGTSTRGLGGYSSYSTSSSGGTEDLTIAGELMALYARVGRLEDAHRIEKEILNLGLTNYYQDVNLQIAAWFAAVDMSGETESALDKAVVANPDVKVQAAQTLLTLAKRLKDAELRKKAAARYLAALDEKIREYPLNPALVSERAWFLLREGGPFEEVAKTAEAMLAVDSDDASALRLLGWSKFRMGDAAAALPLFERADRLLVDQGREFDVDTSYGLGLTLAKLGRRDEAGVWLRRGLVMNGEYPEADEARAAVQ